VLSGDQAIRLQAQQRFAHDRTRDAELFADLVFRRQLRADGKTAGDDLLEDLAIKLIAQTDAFAAREHQRAAVDRHLRVGLPCSTALAHLHHVTGVLRRPVAKNARRFSTTRSPIAWRVSWVPLAIWGNNTTLSISSRAAGTLGSSAKTS